MRDNRVDPVTGNLLPDPADADKGVEKECSAEVAALRRGPLGSGVVEAVVGGREAGRGWIQQHKLYVGAALVFGYVLLVRLMGEAAN